MDVALCMFPRIERQEKEEGGERIKGVAAMVANAKVTKLDY